jgi:trimeric autotransporter adhesin
LPSLRSHLSYANIVSTIALFLVLGGATAFAAKQLGKNSVGTRQLKDKAVTSAKIRNGSVTGAKLGPGAVSAAKLGPGSVGASEIANGAVTAAKLGPGSVHADAVDNGAIAATKLGTGSVGTRSLADGSVTAAKLEPALLGGAHVVARARGAGPQTLTSGSYKLNDATFTQAAGEIDLYVGAARVTIPATCGRPRRVEMTIAVDAPFANPSGDQIVGTARLEDGGGTTVTRSLNFAAGNAAAARLGTDAAGHTLSMTGSLSCGEAEEGRPLTIESGEIDVIGVR